MPARKFEYSDGKSHKFWNIELSGNEVKVNYGRIGTDGQSKTKELADADAAKKEFEKLIKQKMTKGYQEVGDAAGSSAGESGDGAGVLNPMMFSTTKDSGFAHLKTFIGHRVIVFAGEKSVKKGDQVYAIRMSWDEEGVSFADHFDAFMKTDGPANTVGLVIGAWSLEGPEPCAPIVKMLCDNKDKFPKLVAIFFGDIEMEESEISWIELGDLSPVLDAFPNLELFRVRGSDGLQFKNAKHDKLRALAVESGGLGKEVVTQVCKAKFPNLEHLELWLGTPNYGGDCRANDLQPILAGKAFPKLTYLGFRNSEIADDIAGVVVSSPVVEQLETLDLSLGTLSDEGGNALLSLSADGNLKRLDVYHHFMSAATVKKVKGLSLTVNATDKKEPEDWGDGEFRFVAIGE